MGKKKTVFFAYESGENNNVDSIKYAIKEINNNKKYVASSWEDLKINGNIINHKVLRKIEECDIFACDLTSLNFNVLYELGYAIGKRKGIFIILNEKVKGAKDNYSSIRILKTIGYTPFLNGNDIVKGFLQRTNFKEKLLDNIVSSPNDNKIQTDIFYVHNRSNYQAEIDLRKYLDSTDFSIAYDDKAEVEYRPLIWYVNRISSSRCIIIHFLGQNSEDTEFENIQKSFYAGLAKGMNREVLLLAEEPFKAPIDYDEILINYANSKNCITSVVDWLDKNLTKRKGENVKKVLTKEDREFNLLKLGIGDEVAEAEEQMLMEYFIETAAYVQANDKSKILFIGRKGEGKSALYLKLKDDFSNDEKSFVIDIKPESNELLKSGEFLKTVESESFKTDIYITIWKYVIYSKLIGRIYDIITSRHRAEYSIEEKDLIDYFNKNDKLINSDFFGALDTIFGNHKNIDKEIMKDIQKKYITEPLRIICAILKKEKYSKVILLADNLDKTWEQKNDLTVQVHMVLSLLQCAGQIADDIALKINKGIPVKVYIFLRKDIYEYIIAGSREADKIRINTYDLSWEKSPKLLKKLLEERFKRKLMLEKDYDIENIWNEYFNFNGVDAFSEIIKRCMAKPRDILYFTRHMFVSAINNSNDKVTFEDLHFATQEYAEYLKDALIAELNAEFPMIRNIVNNITPKIKRKIGLNKLIKQIEDIGVSKGNVNEILRLLIEKEFMYIINKNDGSIITDLGNALEINNGFYSKLRIDKCDVKIGLKYEMIN